MMSFIELGSHDFKEITIAPINVYNSMVHEIQISSKVVKHIKMIILFCKAIDLICHAGQQKTQEDIDILLELTSPMLDTAYWAWRIAASSRTPPMEVFFNLAVEADTPIFYKLLGGTSSREISLTDMKDFSKESCTG